MASSSLGGLLRNYQLTDDPIECSLQEELSTQEADLGILSSCPSNAICVAHPESSQGGFCQHRTLQQDLSTGEFCRSNSRFATLAVDESCDCSAFDPTSQQGSFVCLIYDPGHCFQENLCGSLTVKQTFDDYDKTEFCYDFQVPISAEVCYHYSFNAGDPDRSCSISVDGVDCNSCRVINYGIDGLENGCLEMDCTNTAADVSGIDCSGGLVMEGVFRDIVPEPTSVPPTSVPTSSPSTTDETVSTSTSTSPPTISPSLPFPTRTPSPPPIGTTPTITTSPTFGPPSTTDQPSHEPKFSLTISPAMSFPRFSLTAAPAVGSASPPTASPTITSTPSPSDGSNPTAPPITSTPSPSNGSNPTEPPITSTPSPSDGSNSTAPTIISTPSPSDGSNSTATPSSPPTLILTSAPVVANETRGPSDVSSITGSGSSPDTSGSDTNSFRLDATCTVFSLVVVLFTSLAMS